MHEEVVQEEGEQEGKGPFSLSSGWLSTHGSEDLVVGSCREIFSFPLTCIGFIIRAEFREYRHLLTFIFAIDDINSNPAILPNITLGYHLYDSCGNVNKVLKDVLQIMSGHSVTAPNYSCMDHGDVAGYIGDQGSATTLPMAQLLGMYGYTQTSAPGCRLTMRDYEFEYKYSQDGDVIIGGIFTVHSAIMKWYHIGKLFYKMICTYEKYRKYRHLLTFIFAINDINNNPSILPNITLGYHLYDSCGNVNKVLKDVLQIMSGHSVTAPNYSCMDHGDVAGYIGDQGSATTLPMAQLLGMYGYTQLRHYMKLLCISDLEKGSICFNDKGEIPEALEILNFIAKRHNNSGRIETVQGLTASVGTFDGSLAPDQQLNISKLEINWINNKVPYSRCSEQCSPGSRKAVKKGHVICCYDCILCSNGEVSNKSDAENCEKCFYTEWPNESRDKCVPKVIEFLSYDTDVVAYVFLLLLVLSSTTITFLIGIFIFFRNTPVVRANNRNLSFIILVSLKLSLLCIFLFIGKPVDITCMLRHVSFGIIFTVVLSSILAKTIIVCIAFKSTTPGSSWRKWLGVKLPNSIVMILSSLQVLNAIFWLLFSPPFQELDMDSYPGKITIQCNEGSRLAFYVMLGYMGFLAAVSLILAFMVRKLPDIYNEAKHITFSMLVFFSVWICAIPAYLSSKGKHTVSVEVFAILASGNGIMVCIFLPKLWNILANWPDYNMNGMDSG
ncbi:vomeronasal type-2 receptor 26-like [Ranitomeya imitator]|uniref:vomeronasal type-2 receptor 26-like n=1 Tax=Ranitomeya imitator TaxID=111125 RepID=UPI0037E92249